MVNFGVRKVLRAYGSVLLAVGLIWLIVLLYIVASNFSIAFITGIILVSLSTAIFPFLARRQKFRPWSVRKVTALGFTVAIYLMIMLSVFLFFAVRGRVHFISFVASLFVLYMTYISIRTWIRARSVLVITLDAATVIAVAVNVVASFFSLHDLLISFGRGVLINAAIVMVVISTTATKHNLISGALHYIQDRFSSIRNRKAKKALTEQERKVIEGEQK
jgi:hypothetical protein